MGDALADYLAWLRLEGKSELTIRGRRGALHRLARQLPVPVLAASAGDLLAWRKAMTVGPVSVRSYVSHVQQFYAWAAARDLIGASPAAGIPVPRQARRLPRPIGTSDLFAAVAQAPDRIRLWLVLAAWCGLRAKEIALLRRDCILLNAAPPVLLVAGDATKGTRERTVPLSRFTAGEITAARLPLSGWCFLRHDGRPGPNRPAHVSALAAAYLHDCGIAATLHQLRHWFGTQAYHVHKDLRTVQELMGHASIQSTQIYADWDRSAAAGTVEALPVPPRLRAVGELPAAELAAAAVDPEFLEVAQPPVGGVAVQPHLLQDLVVRAVFIVDELADVGDQVAELVLGAGPLHRAADQDGQRGQQQDRQHGQRDRDPVAGAHDVMMLPPPPTPESQAGVDLIVFVPARVTAPDTMWVAAK